MTDAELIARLRSMHWCVTTEANGVGVSDSKVALDAADRIEALTRERDEAYRLFAFWRAEADRLTEHNGRACVRAETAADRIEALLDALEAARAERAKAVDRAIATLAEIKAT
jgi:hypothetical protein